MHLEARDRKEAVVKPQKLGSFITFILLSDVPLPRADANSKRTHPQLATASLISLTQFLKTVLNRVQETPRTRRQIELPTVFRLSTPE